MIEAACILAENTHYKDIRRHQMVKLCNTAAGNISRVMGSMDELRTALIEHAIVNDKPVIVAQAILDKHPAITHLSKPERAVIMAAVV